MKAIIIGCVCLLFSAMLSQAQTLQFSGVILVNSATQTVPSGKVWKVESFQQSEVRLTSSSNGSSCSSEDFLSAYVINGQRYYQIGNVATGSGSLFGVAENPMPIWLPANTTVATLCTNDFLSIIEFNIIP